MSLFSRKKNVAVNAAMLRSSAIEKASRGHYEPETAIIEAERARNIYGFNNYALNKSPEEIRETWISVSEDLRKKRT
ncbi:hypothetical protein [Pantoea agglomerans]|uniref:hypothetical protein n=1 Tax=Enterobacter agglomerans TaxID=549 RepID=UPI003FD51D88